MQGDKKGISSIKINDQYRLEFMVTIDTENEPVITPDENSSKENIRFNGYNI